MRNILYFYNMGKREWNRKKFLAMLEREFGIYEKELEGIVSGYKFLFNSESGSEIKVLFFDNGTQLMTVFQGELAEDVIAVYQAFANCFFDEEFDSLDYMKKEFNTDRILQRYIETTSKKVNNQGFCKDKELLKPCERCILKEKCIVKD